MLPKPNSQEQTDCNSRRCCCIGADLKEAAQAHGNRSDTRRHDGLRLCRPSPLPECQEQRPLNIRTSLQASCPCLQSLHGSRQRPLLLKPRSATAALSRVVLELPALRLCQLSQG